ncbi:apolipoprotein D-like [Anopheles nili]|uniref:apolipoprotein D-like n=1 Tax=Anopheles nili TaxID=185578 RepID=UPI00237B2E50|nr:apolipoprotein D-like [Anopheles nili]
MAYLWCGIDVSRGAILTTNCIPFDEDYNFKEDKFDGTWYEVRRLNDPQDVLHEDCVVTNYQIGDEGSFEIQQSYQIGDESEPIYRAGRAEPKVFHNGRVSMFLQRFNTTASADPDTTIDIVATDYTNYAIIYSCTSINTTYHDESAWVLSRQPALAKNVVELVNVFLETRFKREDHKWRAIKQTADFCKPSRVEKLNSHLGGSQPLGATGLLPSIVLLLLARLFH